MAAAYPDRFPTRHAEQEHHHDGQRQHHHHRPLIATDMANSPTPAIYGILIILNMQTSADTILLNDSSRVLSAASQAAVATSDQAYVANDSMAIRVTMRLGFGVLRPNRLARLTVNKTPAKQ